jgi:hypothetical protein
VPSFDSKGDVVSGVNEGGIKNVGPACRFCDGFGWNGGCECEWSCLFIGLVCVSGLINAGTGAGIGGRTFAETLDIARMERRRASSSRRIAIKLINIEALHALY